MRQIKKAMKVRHSAWERDNEVLRRAQRQKLYEKLEKEAAEYFANPNVDRREASAFRNAALQTLSKD